MRKIALLIATLSVATLLTACGASGNDAATATVTTTVTAVESAPEDSPPAASTTASSLAPPDGVLTPGTTYKGADFSVQMIEYRKNSARSAPDPTSDKRWDSVLVRVCIQYSGGSVSWQPWSLLGSDDASYEASSDIYNQFPSPEYPNGDKAVSKGQCIKGWITFPATQTIRQVQYTYTDDDENSQIVVWSI